jgi:hypothetical protein
MEIYRSYLTNSNNDILAFETHSNFNKMIEDYNSLKANNFFSQFNDYDKIFISTKGPLEKPYTDKLYEISIIN